MKNREESTDAAIDDQNRAGREELERALHSVLTQLHEYLDDVVVIGGWVPHLYQRYGSFPEWRSKLSLTSEVDVLVSQKLAPETRATLADTLIAAHFTPTTDDGRAAVWINDTTIGEKIEFLVPNLNTGSSEGKVILVSEQPGIGAIALSALDIMSRHTQRMTIPLLQAASGRRELSIRLPTLGAYVINKAATFNKRSSISSGDGSNPKRAKDLLYLRDIMAGGDQVAAAVEADIRMIVDSDSQSQSVVDTAANHVDLVSKQRASARSEEVAAMLSERDGVSREAAAADIGGRLLDLAELLIQFRGA